VGIRQRQRGRTVGRLAGAPQRFPTGTQDSDPGAGPQQGVGQPGAGLDQVLAVVDDQEHAPGLERFRQGGHERAPWLLADPDGRPARLRDQS
jgi:hypothetical protein